MKCPFLNAISTSGQEVTWERDLTPTDSAEPAPHLSQALISPHTSPERAQPGDLAQGAPSCSLLVVHPQLPSPLSCLGTQLRAWLSLIEPEFPCL